MYAFYISFIASPILFIIRMLGQESCHVPTGTNGTGRSYDKIYLPSNFQSIRYALLDISVLIVYSTIKNQGILEESKVKTVKVMIDEKEVELIAKIQMVNNRSMYPFRKCLENMGTTVLWDSANQIAIGEYNGITVEFPIGKNEYIVNGVKYEMDAASYIDNSIGRTYIPIRYAAESLGFTVDWQEEKSKNIISIYN